MAYTETRPIGHAESNFFAPKQPSTPHLPLRLPPRLLQDLRKLHRPPALPLRFIRRLHERHQLDRLLRRDRRLLRLEEPPDLLGQRLVPLEPDLRPDPLRPERDR